MYKRIEAQLALLGLSKRELASQMGIAYHTLLRKLNGASRFTLEEAIRLKTVIQSPESIEYLFDRLA